MRGFILPKIEQQ